MKNRQFAIRRRGLSLSGLFVILVSITSVGTMAWLASPMVLHAGVSANKVDENNLSKLPDEFRGLIDSLDILLRKSKATCLIREGADSQNLIEFIVLWVSDDEDIGHVNESEVAVLRFSKFLGSVTIYAREEKQDVFSEKQKNISVDRMLNNISFIDSFLHHADTRGRVIGVHITSMRIDRSKLSDNSASASADWSLGRIELTYRSNSSDTSVVAFVPTALPPLNR